MRAIAPLALLVFTAVAVPIPLAHSEDVPVTGAVLPGTLTISKVPARIPVPQLVADGNGWRRATVHLPVTVTDARGSGAGWALTLSAKVRTAKGRSVSGATATLWRIAARCGSCTRPRSRVVLPLRLQERRGVRAVVAAPRTGMGRVSLMAEIAVAVPKRAPAGGYVLRPTLSRISGP